MPIFIVDRSGKRHEMPRAAAASPQGRDAFWELIGKSPPEDTTANDGGPSPLDEADTDNLDEQEKEVF